MNKTLRFLAFAAVLLTAGRGVHAQDALTGSVAAAGSDVNFTTEGTSDWAHWGLNGIGYDHKALGGSQISDYTQINGYPPLQFSDNAYAVSWTDGTPNAASGGTHNGIYTGNLSGGFQITVYADTRPRTLKLYVGGYQSGGTLTASLSDDTASAYLYVDSSAGQSGLGNTDGSHYYAVYTLTYQAASADQTLTVAWTQNSSGGNINLVGATLSGAKPPLPAAPVLTASAGTNRVHLAWTPPTGGSQYNIKRSTTSTGAYTTIGTTSSTSYDDTTALNGTTYYYVVSAVNSTGEGPNSNQASAKPVPGIDGTGLTGQYYNGDNGGNPTYDAATLIATQVDPGINFNAEGTRPAGVPSQYFSVKWTGSVKAPVDGDYVFTTNADDGIRLFIDGSLVIDDFVFQGPTLRSTGPITFAAGSTHTIEVDYFQDGGGGLAQLLWAYPGQPQQIIPYYNLFPVLPQTAPAAPTNLVAFAGNNSVALSWNTTFNADAYRIKRSTTSTGTFTTIATVPAALYTAVNTYTDKTALNNTRYFYKVSASNAYGESANSNTASAFPNALSLVLKYTFEDGPGTNGNNTTVTDVTGNGYNGTFSLPNGFVTDPANGKYAGSTDAGPFRYFTPGINSLNNQFTIFTYYKLPTDSAANPVGNIQTIVANAASGQSSGFKLFVNNFQSTDHAIVLEARDGTNYGGFSTAAGAFPADGKFHAVALSVDRTAGSAQIYVDGALKGSVSNLLGSFSLATGQIQVGVFPGGGFITTAEFDDFQIFGRNLNASEVASLSATGTTVTGKIALEGVTNLAGVPAAVGLGTFHIEFRTPGTTTVIKSADVTLTPVGTTAFGTFSVSGVTPGTYDVAIKSAKQLRVVVPNAAITGSTYTLANVTLPSGDATNDNIVDIGDFGVLVNAYGGDVTIAGSGYNAAADFDYNGVVDIGDFGILVNEYGNSGAN